jgi:dienelactone hydrolase
MNKQFYILAIFFISLSMAAGLVQNIVYLLAGGQIFYMASFLPWFSAVNIVLIIAAYYLLKYYEFHHFRFAFWAGLVSLLINVFQSALIVVLIFNRQIQAVYIVVVAINVLAGFVYALSLVLSGTARRRWLRAGGICFIFLSAAMAVILVLTFTPAVDRGLVEKSGQWALLIGSLIPGFFILNMIEEIKTLPREIPTIVGNAGALLSVGALVIILTFGILIVRDAQTTMYWRKQNEIKAMEFVSQSAVGKFGTAEGDTLDYVLMKPLDPDPQQTYPLVVCLPYGGYEAPAAQVLAEESYRRKYPAYLFVPRCPDGAGWGGIPNYPTIDSLVFEAITELGKRHRIDTDRIYVTGISRGGYGSWHFITTRPDLFAAAVPVCGRGEPEMASRIVNVPVWAFHGAKDMNVPVTGSRDVIEAMRKAGGEPRYTEYPDEAHNIWHRVSTTTDLWDWLFDQRRGSPGGTESQHQGI